MTNTFASRMALIQQRVEAAAVAHGRAASEVRVVAVAKTASDSDLLEAQAAGHRCFAHNRVQPLQQQQAVVPAAEWHLIGPLQRNKARKAMPLIGMLQTLAGEKLADHLNRLAEELRESPLPVLLQVNLTPEDGRAGLHPDQVQPFLDPFANWPWLDCRGLMTMAPFQADADLLHRHFAQLRKLATDCQDRGLLPPTTELSMGMSNDFEIAIAEGATLVRIGRALFPPAP
jgi:PLP dependent protein